MLVSYNLNFLVFQALHAHMSCRISANTFETTANYLPLISKRLTQPLIREGEDGVDKVKNLNDHRSSLTAIFIVALCGNGTVLLECFYIIGANSDQKDSFSKRLHQAHWID